MPILRLTRLSDIIFAMAMTILAIFFDPIPLDNISPETLTQLLLRQRLCCKVSGSEEKC